MITQHISNARLTPMIDQHFAASNAVEEAISKLRPCQLSNLPGIEADMMKIIATLSDNLRDLWSERRMREACK